VFSTCCYLLKGSCIIPSFVSVAVNERTTIAYRGERPFFATLRHGIVAAASPDSRTRLGQVCEATFYGGELVVQQGAREDASRLFRLAAADCSREFVEGSAASADLNVLYKNP
jgi:hypothetical protein